ncbi:hypothetical protein J6590_101857 [Homalodisca vitripennis]|nr:hypothetical protein J6590_101857 [Homalodisca vitripennis]
MERPHPGGTAFVITVTPTPGKYECTCPDNWYRPKRQFYLPPRGKRQELVSMFLLVLNATVRHTLSRRWHRHIRVCAARRSPHRHQYHSLTVRILRFSLVG